MFIGKMGNKIRSSLVSQTNLRNLSFFTFVRLFSLSSKGSCQKHPTTKFGQKLAIKKQSCLKLNEMEETKLLEIARNGEKIDLK